MKKTILTIFFIFVWATFIFSQSIIVTKPSAGENWEKGRRYEITWRKSGRMDANVKIRLFNKTGTTRILGIVNSTPNDGSYHWSIPGSLRSDEYVIKVKTTDNRFFDDSSGFNIIATGVEEIPGIVEITPPEVEITSITRAGAGAIRIGNTVSIDVRVVNNGSSRADAFASWITVIPPFFDVGSRGNRAIILRSSFKVFRLTIPVTARNFRNGKFKAKIFIGDAGVSEQNVIKVLFKDSNLANHQKEFGNIASSVISIRQSSIRNTYLSNWYTKMPTHAFCTKTILQPTLRLRTNTVLLGQLNLWRPGADPLPCHNGTHHYFYGAANFDLRRLRGLEISQAVIKFTREMALPSGVVFNHPNSENPKVMVIRIGRNTIETGHDVFANSALGKIRPGGFLDVTEVIRSLISREETVAGFSFAQSRVNLQPYNNDVRLFDYEFELEVRISE